MLYWLDEDINAYRQDSHEVPFLVGDLVKYLTLYIDTGFPVKPLNIYTKPFAPCFCNVFALGTPCRGQAIIRKGGGETTGIRGNTNSTLSLRSAATGSE